MHIYLSSPNSSLTQADDVTVTIQDPSRDVDPIKIDVAKAGAGHVINNSAYVPLRRYMADRDHCALRLRGGRLHDRREDRA